MRIVKGLEEKTAAGTERADRMPAAEKDLLNALPKPARWLNMSRTAQKIYGEFGEKLIAENRLKDLDSYAVAMLAVEFEKWSWANKAINLKNAKQAGAGYIQHYATGATNITTELVVQKEAFKKIMELSVKFGLTTRDRRTMNDTASLAQQLDLFEEIGFNMVNAK